MTLMVKAGVRIGGVPFIAAFVTAAAAVAAPHGGPDRAEIASYRSQGYPVCLAIHPLVARDGTVNENAIEECYCGLDRLIAERGSTGLPRLDASNAETLLDPHLAQCRGGTDGGHKVPATDAPPTADSDGAEAGGKPVADPAGDLEAPAPAPDSVADAKPAAPAWLAWTGLPVWALWLFPIVAALAGLVLFLTRRRRGGRGDLIRPPPSMRTDSGDGPRERE